MSVHPSVILWFSILFYFQPQLVFPFLLAATIHELGHAGMLYFLNRPPLHLEITFGGAKMTTAPMGYREERLAAGAGPISSMLLFLLFPLFPATCWYSLVLGIINLLPLPGLDGWRVLHCTLMLHLPPEAAQRITSTVSIIFGSVLIAGSLGVSIRYKLGLWPILFACYFLLRTIRSLR